MGRPSGCNCRCEGGGNPPNPPQETCYSMARNSCSDSFAVDDFIIKFTRQNPSSDVNVSYTRYDWTNGYPVYVDDYYYSDNCTVCFNSGNSIVNSSCSITSSATSQIGICNGVDYCDAVNYEYVKIRDVPSGYFPSITNANVISSGNHSSFCGGCFGHYNNNGWGWGSLIAHAKCINLRLYIPPGFFHYAYRACNSLENITAIVGESETPTISDICVKINDWDSFINSMRDTKFCFDSCEYNFSDLNFGEDFFVYQGAITIEFLGVCEWQDSAPECLRQ